MTIGDEGVTGCDDGVTSIEQRYAGMPGQFCAYIVVKSTSEACERLVISMDMRMIRGQTRRDPGEIVDVGYMCGSRSGWEDGEDGGSESAPWACHAAISTMLRISSWVVPYSGRMV